MRKDLRAATSLRAWAVLSDQSVTISQCVLSRQIESPTSSASCSSSAEVSTSAERQRFVCLAAIKLSKYEARGPAEDNEARAR